MKKIMISVLMFFLLCSPSFGAQWQNAGADGAQFPENTEINDLDNVSQDYVIGPLDTLLSNYRNGFALTYSSASQIAVSAGEIVVSNSNGSVRLFLKNTSATTISFSDLDTGSESASKYYYVYAIAATSASTTATFKISLSASAPLGVTYYKKIGYFYNDSSSNISTTRAILNYLDERIGYAPELLNSLAGSYSVNVTYQNTSDRKLLVTVEYAYVNEYNSYAAYSDSSSTPTTRLAYVYGTGGDSTLRYFPFSFVVLPKHYFKITSSGSTLGIGDIYGWEM